MLRVAAYCRVSTDAQDQTNSLRSQKEYFSGYIQRNINWKLVDIYADEGISGTQAKKRPEFMRMIHDAENKKIDLILTKEISRFARNTLDSLQYTRMLKSIGVGVLFINDNINTLEPDAELRLTIMSSIAQEEVRKTSERVKWGQKRRMEQGVVFGNGVYGYRLNNGVLSINEEEAEVVRLIYHKFLHEGKGAHIIAKELREEGHYSKHKKEWSSANILNIIGNEKYCGDLLQKKEYTPNYLDHKKIKNRGVEKQVYIKDHHCAIIDRKTWNEAQKERKKRSPSKEATARYSNRYWCSGKIKCGYCGRSFIHKTYRRKYGEYRVWVCSNQSKNGFPKIDQYGKRIGCDNINVNNKALAACMKYAIHELTKKSDRIISDVLNTIQQAHGAYQNTGSLSLERKMASLKDKKEKVIELYVNGILGADEIKSTINQYNKEIEALEKRLSDRAGILNSYQQQANEIKSTLESFLELEISESVLKRLLETVTVYKDRIEIKFNDIPLRAEIKYETTGVKNWYKTTVTSCKIL